MTPEIRKQLQTSWTRMLGRAANWVQNQEANLDRMRAKKISEEFIAARSAEIDDMLTIINTADELITLYRNQLIQERLENRILLSQLSQAQQLDFIKSSSPSLLTKLNETKTKPAAD